MAKLLFGYSLAVCGGLVWACTTSGGGGFSDLGGQSGGASSIFAGGTTGSGVVSKPAGGSSSGQIIASGTPPKDKDASVAYRRPKVCDENGENCRCINLASLGARASSAYGTGSDGQPSSTTAFDTWLTEKSNANVTMVDKKPGTIDIDYLNGFDVIILQDLREWNLNSSELQALEQWVNEGGGLISLNGYMNNDDKEVDATNKVIAFTGMSYNGGATAGSVPGGDCPASSMDICTQASSACCYCWNNTIPITEWDTNHPVANPDSTFKAVGAYYGRSINEGDGQVVATYTNKTVAASKAIGNGKFFAWCDEWVTYTSQWSGGRVGDPQNENEWEPCYVASDDPPHWLTADKAFQTKQFWFNVISWVSPPTECDFVIDEPEVKVWLI